MKIDVATATLILAAISQVAAAPAPEGPTKVTALTTRELDTINNAIAGLEHYNAKRDLMTIEEMQKREVQIVTDVLAAIKDTNLAPAIIKYIIDDPTLSGIATDVIVWAIQNGVVHLDTLLKALNDSGLAVDVIKDLINDCQFYAQIYKIVLKSLANLPSLIASLLGLNTSQVSNSVAANAKRELIEAAAQSKVAAPVFARADDDDNDLEYTVLTSLMESLKNSGLANQVVEALVVDDQFYTWGADLIEQLFSSGAITLGELLSALIDSGLIPSILEAFLNVDTLKSVIVNALAAAFGNCQSVSPTTSFQTSVTTTITSSISVPSSFTLTSLPSGSATSTPTGVICRKKKKRRSY
ncbi:Opaque-phase-specific protein OP4 [Candida viswanathii]|jgi:hypothetical protein|uniref:Opaque-phase-specific protein OP4 n=1 Tax=Candida viswanathii TaxID=5486 RepID=A0A367XRI7_9ASCO|nr:Opaque-phase-specific protein OP4 [Candida viswanathii]